MKKILFVEDDALIARIYSQKLEEEGFEVAVAEDGVSAIKKLPEFKPALVVLDLLMPRLTGADVLKFIRRHPDLQSTRVLVFSNSFVTELMDQIAASGVEKALIKSSVTPKHLIEVINEMLAGPPHETTPPAAAAPAEPAAIATPPPAEAAAPVEVAKTEPPPAREKDSDPEFRAHIRNEFLERVPAMTTGLRQVCREFLESAGTPAEPERLMDLTRKTAFFAQMAGMAGCQSVSRLGNALEALLFHLEEKPSAINDSVRHTITSTVMTLTALLDLHNPDEARPLPADEILVVDDDAVTNRALVIALAQVGLKATGVTDPFDALNRLEQNPFSLVVLDVEMPGMDGLALCEKLRGLPKHKRTPVIFVTSHTDFKTHSQSVLAGGDDLITKPILPIELGVKAMKHVAEREARAAQPG